METQAAVLWERNSPWSVETIELDPPKEQEVLVELHAAGMCHTEEHILTGDMPFQIPFVGGHEGAGVVKEVGERVSWLKPGDHVVVSFVPACGRCPSCSTGHQNLCDLGALIGRGRQIFDGGSRHHARGQELSISSGLGVFAQHTVVNEASCVKIEDHHALDRACLLSCGFVTGWGASVYAAEIEPGHNVVVAGLGGIGAAAVQGAKLSGARTITVIDPVESKREKARELGATHVAESWEKAPAVVKAATWNRGADRFICAMGVGEGKLIAQALRMVGKRGWLVVVNMHRAVEHEVAVSMMDLALMEKRIVGTLYGSANPRADIPKMLELWSTGDIDLDAMVTRTYPLEKINDGFEDMRAGRNVRGVLRFPAADA